MQLRNYNLYVIYCLQQVNYVGTLILMKKCWEVSIHCNFGKTSVHLDHGFVYKELLSRHLRECANVRDIVLTYRKKEKERERKGDTCRGALGGVIFPWLQEMRVYFYSNCPLLSPHAKTSWANPQSDPIRDRTRERWWWE